MDRCYFSLGWKLAWAALLALMLPAPLRAQGPVEGPITAEQVRAAIDGGIKYLFEQQNAKDGSWQEIPRYPGGVTSLCVLALLNSGVEPSHPQIKKSLGYLRGIEPSATYSVALQTMVFCEAEPRVDRFRIQRNVDWLQSIQLPQGEWSYPGQDTGDNSNSQFAVLALHEAERVGAVVQPQTWERAAKHWKACQNVDGSWGYSDSNPAGLGSMTCAGIGAMVICNSRVQDPNADVANGMVQCCQPQAPDDGIDIALSWMGRNFSVRRNPSPRGGGNVWHYYYLYALERVGRLTAHRFIGNHDWYREGAEFLVRQQDPFSHSWRGQNTAEDQPQIATAMALLFLSKGRRPLLVSKLEHGPENDWNNHEHDLAHITAEAEAAWDLDLTWQIVDPQEASVDDLLQSPVLFLTGSKSPQLDGTEQKMRDYLDRGGFLFAEACCLDGTRFKAGFREYLDRVFPEKEYDLVRVGPEHPLWRVERLVRPESPYVGRLWAVEYGCRTCVVFSEIDLSCYWELYGRGQLRGVPDAIQKRLEDAVSIGLNVLAYATNREPKGKEEAFTSTANLIELSPAGSRGVMRIANLQHGGGCNDAPGALVNLLRTAAEGDLQLGVNTNAFPLRADDPNLWQFNMAFMQGRHDFRLTPAERTSLAEYLKNGGMVFANSICSSNEFTAAFRREMQAVLPDVPLEHIPPGDVLLSTAAGGYDISEVERRDPVEGGADQPLRARVRKVSPELEGMKIDGRWAVIFSPYDISCALEKHESLQCRGYTQKDAARIGMNVVEYMLNPDVE